MSWQGEYLNAVPVKPYHVEEAGIIWNCDCRDILPHLPKVDLVLTDPPYGLNIASNPFRQKFKPEEWDAGPCPQDIIEMLMQVSSEQVIWGGNYFELPPSQGFFIWDKLQPQNFSSSMCEFAWSSKQSPAKVFKKWVVSEEKYHPTQKPVALMRWILEFFDNHTILDPFLGSGTTAVAAKELGRKFIGIEISEEYCKIAVKRLRQGVLNFG